MLSTATILLLSIVALISTFVSYKLIENQRFGWHRRRGEYVGWWRDVLQGVGTEMVGAIITFFIITLAYEAISARNELQLQLLRDVASNNNATALRAVNEMRENGWLEAPGLLRGEDLRAANLAGGDLRGADLREVDLRQANLTDADLRDADLSGSVLDSVDFTGANLRGANLSFTSLDENLRDVSIMAGVINRDIETVLEEDPGLDETNRLFLSDATKSESSNLTIEITQATLDRLQSGGLNLSAAAVIDSYNYSPRIDFTSAILTDVDFSNSDLSFSNFNGAVVAATDFQGANLHMSNFTGAVTTDTVTSLALDATYNLEGDPQFNRQTMMPNGRGGGGANASLDQYIDSKHEDYFDVTPCVNFAENSTLDDQLPLLSQCSMIFFTLPHPEASDVMQQSVTDDQP